MIISELQNNILKNKKPLMGLAICLIMWFHSIYDVQNAALALVKNMCDIGVDMFMFLSGFSMAYSFQKNSNVTAYQDIASIFSCVHFCVLVSRHDKRKWRYIGCIV